MVDEPRISVVIPTRDRVSMLLRVLTSLLGQEADLDGRLEIVVVDDGSSSDICAATEVLVSECDADDRVRCLRQSPCGPAAARNVGVRAARSPIVLFVGDDIIPLPGFLSHHVKAHTIDHPGHNIAVLGLADLPPEYCQTPFVNWWRIWNFRYEILLKEKREPDFSFFYTNNLSIKRAFLLEHGLFDESFRYAAYEDGELGLRLMRQGLKLVFYPEAQALHYHEISLASACQRMITKGRAYDLFTEKTGALGLSRLWMWAGSGFWMRPELIRPLYRLAAWAQSRVRLPLVYVLVLMYHFQVGRGRVPPLDQ